MSNEPNKDQPSLPPSSHPIEDESGHQAGTVAIPAPLQYLSCPICIEEVYLDLLSLHPHEGKAYRFPLICIRQAMPVDGKPNVCVEMSGGNIRQSKLVSLGRDRSLPPGTVIKLLKQFILERKRRLADDSKERQGPFHPDGDGPVAKDGEGDQG